MDRWCVLGLNFGNDVQWLVRCGCRIYVVDAARILGVWWEAHVSIQKVDGVRLVKFAMGIASAFVQVLDTFDVARGYQVESLRRSEFQTMVPSEEGNNTCLKTLSR